MTEKCKTCEDRGKVLIYPDGTVKKYLPALAMDSHHKGARVSPCPDCTIRQDT